MDYSSSASARAGSWDLFRLPGLLAWYDASVQQAGAFTTVPDRTGHGYDLTVNSATFSQSGWNGGRPAFVFVPTQSLSTADTGIAGLVNGSSVPVTVLQVASVTDTASFKYMTCWSVQPGVSGSYEIYLNASEQIVVDESSSGGGSVTGSVSVAGLHTHAVVFDGSKLTVYIDGVIDSSLDHVSFGTLVAGANSFSFGQNGVGSNGYSGSLAEMAVVTRGLTAPEVAAFHAYARRKWGGLPA